MNEDDGSDVGMLDLFTEPEDYFKPPKPLTYETFTLDDGREISLQLVGENPLWAHHLWNGAKILAGYLQKTRSRLITNRSILELGAGAGLPSLVSAILGAENVVVTDYPDPELIENLQYNISSCSCLSSAGPNRKTINIIAMPYLWGAPVNELLSNNKLDSTCGAHPSREHCRFDTLLLADLLFNHSEHEKLVRTVRLSLARKTDSRAVVFFTPYRPWLLERDLNFFKLVEESHTSLRSTPPTNGEDAGKDQANHGGYPLSVRKILQETMDKVMFEDDPGDEMLRRTVFGYEIFWADLQP